MKPAECLEGLELEGGWKVASIVAPHRASTGGHFSIGYVVASAEGSRAFLKALDFSGAFQTPDPARALEAMTSAYNFERDLLERCKRRDLKRIVVPIADGSVQVPGDFGPLGRVSYLIFEFAKGDIRRIVAESSSLDLAWCLRSLHQTCVGLMQLHSIGVAHQDLKPSNVLVFEIGGSKISDLGRAFCQGLASPADDLRIPGDLSYAPPELFYAGLRSELIGRFNADLYMLGSLIFFYFVQCSATHALQTKLRSLYSGGVSLSDFTHDLPYWKQAFAEAISDLRRAVDPVAGRLSNEIVSVTKELCEPDPARRGDPRFFGEYTLLSLERYTSRFNLLARKAELRLV